MKLAVNRTQINGTLTVDLAPDGAGTLLTYSGIAERQRGTQRWPSDGAGLIKGQVDQFFSRLEGQVK